MTVQEQIQDRAREALALEYLRLTMQNMYPEFDIMPKGTAERLRQAEEAEAELAMIAAVLQQYHLATGALPQRGIGRLFTELP